PPPSPPLPIRPPGFPSTAPEHALRRVAGCLDRNIRPIKGTEEDPRASFSCHVTPFFSTKSSQKPAIQRNTPKKSAFLGVFRARIHLRVARPYRSSQTPRTTITANRS